ncbi:MAG: hypothetical protein U9R19_01230, partial [Bacteroidota bacterium]|nr:hypothetical protein [Bacteroidota bacterium]
MKKYFLISYFISVSLLQTIFAQDNASVKDNFGLHVENFNFFKNAEYFNPITDGYTDIGYFLAPAISYNFQSSFRLKAGIHVMRFSGEDGFADVQPIFTASWIPNKNLKMNLGTLEGGHKHKLIEPLYFSDLHWLKNVENGIQFLFQNKYLDADLWLNWEKHVRKTDEFQEHFTFGFTGKTYVYRRINSIDVSLPMQIIITHRGGQGILKTGQVETLANFAAGINIAFALDNSYLKSISIKNYSLAYADLSPLKEQSFTKGFGYLSQLELSNNHFVVDFNYWYAYHFIAPRGNPILQSISEKHESYNRPTRNLLYSGLRFLHSIYNGVDLQVGLQLFYDPLRKELEYSYTLFLKVEISRL